MLHYVAGNRNPIVTEPKTDTQGRTWLYVDLSQPEGNRYAFLAVASGYEQYTAAFGLVHFVKSPKEKEKK